MPILPIAVLLAVSGWFAGKADAANDVTKVSSGTSFDLAKLGGYAIAGGIVYYFGKKIIK